MLGLEGYTLKTRTHLKLAYLTSVFLMVGA